MTETPGAEERGSMSEMSGSPLAVSDLKMVLLLTSILFASSA